MLYVQILQATSPAIASLDTLEMDSNARQVLPALHSRLYNRPYVSHTAGFSSSASNACLYLPWLPLFVVT